MSTPIADIPIRDLAPAIGAGVETPGRRPTPVRLQWRLARRLRAAEVVSFDVFDTAILRPLVQPTDLFGLMETAAAQVAGTALPDFALARPQAEALARERVKRAGRSREVTLDEIYTTLCEVAGLDPDLACRLAGLEIEAEYAICQQNPFIYGIYRHCRELSKRIAFVSDMYLPEAAVAEILRRNGYDAYDLLLVSSTNKKTKTDGSLYHEARSRLHARRWLHIGDNWGADIVMARKHRMATWYYSRCAAEFARSYPAPPPWEPANPIPGSVARGLVANRVAQTRPSPPHTKNGRMFWHEFGYATAGPLFVGFTEWLIAQAAARDLEALYFLARDGLIMRRVYEALAPLSEGGCETHYLWGSRRALNVAAITEINEQSLHFLTGGNSMLEAKDYLDRLGLDWERYTNEFRLAGFASPRQRADGDDARACLRRLFTLVAEPVCERAREERSIVTDYLRHSGMSGGRRIGVVDIGWHGSLQRSITDMLVEEGASPQITGLYLATLGYHTPLFNPKYPHDAYLCRLGQPVAYASLLKTSVEVVELLFSAAEGSIVGIERDHAGNFIPIRDSDELDAGRNEAILRLQEGAMEFVDDYIGLKRRFPDLRTPRQAAVAQLRRVLLHPSRVEAQYIGDVRHADAFGETVKRPIARPPSWSRLVTRPWTFRRGLEESYWRPGRDALVSPVGRAIYRLVMR